jgi:hypothetical protein
VESIAVRARAVSVEDAHQNLTESSRDKSPVYGGDNRLSTVSKKEFSIAAAFVSASGLPSEITVPAVFFAVIQMITSPIAAKLLAARAAEPHECNEVIRC